MTVAGVVEIKDAWEVTVGIPIHERKSPDYIDKLSFHVVADSMMHAIALTMAFCHRDTYTRLHMVQPSDVIGCTKVELLPHILIPTTVAALHYPNVEVQAEIKPEFDYDNPFGISPAERAMNGYRETIENILQREKQAPPVWDAPHNAPVTELHSKRLARFDHERDYSKKENDNDPE